MNINLTKLLEIKNRVFKREEHFNNDTTDASYLPLSDEVTGKKEPYAFELEQAE